MALRYVALVLMAASMSPVPIATQPDVATVFFLRESGADVVVDSIALADGEMKVLSQQEVLAVILPFGTSGMSGDLVQKVQRTGRIAVLRRGGEIHVKIRRPDGQERDLPAVKLAALAAVEIRVNVTGGGGFRKAYVVRGYRDIEPAPGPVLDMFGGKVPLAAGEFAITTEIRPGESLAPLEGRAPLEFDDGLLFVRGEIPGGAAGWFIVDFGAGTTTVDSRALPPDIAVRPLRGIENSGDGTREVAAVMHGAGGEVSGFLGQAVLPRMTIGSVAISSARVNVVKSIPAFGREVAGVLGLDLLGRAAVASLDLSGSPALHLDPKPLTNPSGVPVPFSLAARHLFLDATVDGVDVRLLFDTGARRTLVGPDVAERAGLRLDREHVWEVRGLDGQRLELPSGVASTLAFGSLEMTDQRIYVGELPALRAMGLHGTGGLLGMDVLARFSRVEIDFAAEVIRFHLSR
jgi:hypothetical protein